MKIGIRGTDHQKRTNSDRLDCTIELDSVQWCAIRVMPCRNWRSKKKSRNYPRRKEEPRTDPPKVERADAKQKRLDRELTRLANAVEEWGHS